MACSCATGPRLVPPTDALPTCSWTARTLLAVGLACLLKRLRDLLRVLIFTQIVQLIVPDIPLRFAAWCAKSLLGQYSAVPKAVYRFEVADSRGRLLVARAVTLSEFGTFHETLALDSAAPVGTYRIHVFQPGKSDFTGSFEVHSYQLEPMSLAFDLKKTVFYRGETIQATLVAKYQYGAPVAGRPIEVQLPDGRILHGTTDAAGQFPVEFPTEGFAEEQALGLVARLPQDNVATAASVMLAIQGFRNKPGHHA